ncbi:MAG: hypothetical protein A2Y12_10705 [Planctomycetes bacterium GWF2_42_9]|nr:MAG: hypothetical protein A2Y12_10705 [Planctomycetes bacterium GWF2_42_9]
MSDKIKVLDYKQSDNEYLHKDFHGALCYAIKYIDERYGFEATNNYLQMVGKNIYPPLIARIKKDGLVALVLHFKNIFELEGGKVEIVYGGNRLTIKVHECPAIKHLRKTKQLYTHRYCETTVQINKAICQAADYNCTCAYKPGQAQCVQQFWGTE